MTFINWMLPLVVTVVNDTVTWDGGTIKLGINNVNSRISYTHHKIVVSQPLSNVWMLQPK